MEVRKVFLLTGAEKERKSLEKLLHRRAEFTGQPLDVLEDDNTTSFSTSATSVPGKKMKKVIAFGGDSTVAYGFGEFVFLQFFHFYFFISLFEFHFFYVSPQDLTCTNPKSLLTKSVYEIKS